MQEEWNLKTQIVRTDPRNGMYTLINYLIIIFLPNTSFNNQYLIIHIQWEQFENWTAYTYQKVIRRSGE